MGVTGADAWDGRGNVAMDVRVVDRIVKVEIAIGLDLVLSW